MNESNQEQLLANKPAKQSVKQWLQSDNLKIQIEQALPQGIELNRFLRVLYTQVQKVPKIAQCSQESLFSSIIQCGQLGLLPDGREAHLIPYGSTCQLIVDYKGIVRLVMQTNLVSNIHADIVCDNDVFTYDTGEVKSHTIDFRADRGAMYAVYCIITFKDGTKKSDCMTLAEVEAVRKRSKAGNNGPWVTDFNEMAKKTVFKRLSKWIPWATEDQHIKAMLYDVDDDNPNFSRAKNVTPSIPSLPDVDAETVEQIGGAKSHDK